MNKWKHKDWENFSGTWLICAKLSDSKIIELIKSNPKKYGNLEDWSKQ